MKWLAVWFLLLGIYAGALLLCRVLAGDPLLVAGDLPNLLLIPAAQAAALAGTAAVTASAAAPRRKP